eukprot:Hpha_TRINITY_DN26513_c0_g1::TRINITY_DN26513_c0_g1_i1::g.112933::m.112933/K09568/FKBP1; FK506-binding protein 1
MAQVQKEILKRGKGKVYPETGDRVVIHYTGVLASNGKKFDSSKDRGTPFTTKIGVGHVIAGWDRAVPTMSVGERAKLFIPAALAYGTEPHGQIPPCSDLLFTVELLDVVKTGKKFADTMDKLEGDMEAMRRQRREAQLSRAMQNEHTAKRRRTEKPAEC